MARCKGCKTFYDVERDDRKCAVCKLPLHYGEGQSTDNVEHLTHWTTESEDA